MGVAVGGDCERERSDCKATMLYSIRATHVTLNE